MYIIFDTSHCSPVKDFLLFSIRQSDASDSLHLHLALQLLPEKYICVPVAVHYFTWRLLCSNLTRKTARQPVARKVKPPLGLSFDFNGYNWTDVWVHQRTCIGILYIPIPVLWCNWIQKPLLKNVRTFMPLQLKVNWPAGTVRDCHVKLSWQLPLKIPDVTSSSKRKETKICLVLCLLILTLAGSWLCAFFPHFRENTVVATSRKGGALWWFDMAWQFGWHIPQCLGCGGSCCPNLVFQTMCSQGGEGGGHVLQTMFSQGASHLYTVSLHCFLFSARWENDDTGKFVRELDEPRISCLWWWWQWGKNLQKNLLSFAQCKVGVNSNPSTQVNQLVFSPQWSRQFSHVHTRKPH